MSMDRYTKFILTYIAICLSLITLNEIGVLPNAHAQRGGPQPVVICDATSSKCADVRSTGTGVDGLVITLPGRG